MRRALLLWPLLLALAAPVWADARLTVLVDLVKLREAAQILRDEGLQYARETQAEVLEGRGGAAWGQQIDAIYDTERMVETLRETFREEISPAQVEELITFFVSDPGAEIVALENAARAAMSDRAVEEEARGRYLALAGSDDPRLALLEELVRVGDYLNRNVAAALNYNYQYLSGLADGGALDLSEDEILSRVSADAEEVTEDTTSWLYGYLLMAYHPVSDADLERYIAMARTPAGQAYNRALFTGFARAYEDISYALGRAVALNQTAQEL